MLWDLENKPRRQFCHPVVFGKVNMSVPQLIYSEKHIPFDAVIDNEGDREFIYGFDLWCGHVVDPAIA